MWKWKLVASPLSRPPMAPMALKTAADMKGVHAACAIR
jgi:hypothetical protein